MNKFEKEVELAKELFGEESTEALGLEYFHRRMKAVKALSEDIFGRQDISDDIMLTMYNYLVREEAAAYYILKAKKEMSRMKGTVVELPISGIPSPDKIN